MRVGPHPHALYALRPSARLRTTLSVVEGSRDGLRPVRPPPV